MKNSFASFKSKITHPISYPYFMLTHLPMALVAGLKLTSINEDKAIVRVRFCWLNKNPFKSIYFAVLAMAAELATGLLAFGHSYKQSPAVSLLIIKCEGSFYKKAVGTILFTCKDGEALKSAINRTLLTGETALATCTSTGINEQGEVVASFVFKWSIKSKKAVS